MPLPKLFTDEKTFPLRFSGDYRRAGGKCPTCLGTGTYTFEGQTYPCRMDDYGHQQERVFKALCIAQLPREFQVLEWAKFPHADARKLIDRYTERWETVRMNGLGVMVSGSTLGVGKTWAATRILRQAVIQGSEGYFCQFKDMAGYYELPNAEEREYRQEQLRMAECLVIDDILEPWGSDRHRAFFEDKLEETIRYRAANNLPTITTTNLGAAQMGKYFPRVSSILAGKQVRVDLEGVDYRSTAIARLLEAEEKVLNGEVQPIAIEDGDL